VAETVVVNKPAKPSSNKTYPRPLADLVHRCLGETFARQGFASGDVVTHWPEIVGPEIAAHAEPVKLQWPRGDAESVEPATLVLRVEGPAAIEIQHLSGMVIERVNRFFGWRAVGRIALRQAPLARRGKPVAAPAPDPAEAARVAAALPGIVDDELRQALGRLGAAVKRT
jgi:hypothetical protein